MTDYKKLVEALRCEGMSKRCFTCTYGYRLCPDSECNDACHVEQIIDDAAAAIEALQAEQKKTVTQIFGEEQQEWEEYCAGLMNRIKELKAQLPKRGEWVEDEYGFIHCSECRMEWDEPEHTQTNYCPNCGAKMTEVQE